MLIFEQITFTTDLTVRWTRRSYLGWNFFAAKYHMADRLCWRLAVWNVPIVEYEV